MAREDEIHKLTQDVKVFTTKDLATINFQKGYWGTFQSSLTRTNELLKAFAETGKVIKSGTYWHTPEYRGEYKEHDQLITQNIVELHKPEINPILKREVSFSCGLRSDITALLVKGNKARCAIIEVDLSETIEYLTGKFNQWTAWKDARSALSQLFGFEIPTFDLVSTSGRAGLKFTDYLEAL
jgi:hypothetical protein